LKDYRLYVIIDIDLIDKRQGVAKVAEEVLRGGADVIQLRDKSSEDGTFLKHAEAIKKLAKRFHRPFIINDRVDIARLVDSDGVHLGQDDIPIDEARRLLGNKIIGISTHSLKQAKDAQANGADYIGIGPIYKTGTKKGLAPIGYSVLSRIGKEVGIPYFAIGGISHANIRELKGAGAKKVAVASSAIKAKNIYRSVKKLKGELDDTA